MGELSDEVMEELVLQPKVATHVPRWTPVRVIAAVLAGVAATAAVTRSVVLHGVIGSSGDVVALDEVEAQPAPDFCAKKQDNCLESRCCAVTGFQCFQQNSSYAGCMKKCQSGPNKWCQKVAPINEQVAGYPGLSLFCFAVYTQDTRSTKKSYELELLSEQLKRGVSLFACAGRAVYADVQVPLGYDAAGQEVLTKRVTDENNDFHAVKRPKVGGYINTGMFVQVWKQVARDGEWAHHNWVVKVDPDAVFFPRRLADKLRPQGVPAQGIYLENCEYVNYGYFGNLEVFSHTAFDTLLKNLDTCYTAIDWKTGVEGGKWGPMGEDLFAQRCMDTNGVRRVQAFKMTSDGACQAERPKDQKKNKKYKPDCVGNTAASIHPFKKPDEYFKCMDESLGQ